MAQLRHDKVLSFLLQWREKNTGFTFTLRKSDFGKRLSEGYWFHGNADLIILSFWSGMDWKKKMPNISYCYDFKNRESYLQLSAEDSSEKQKILTEFILPSLSFSNYVIQSSTIRINISKNEEILKDLRKFLITHKLELDYIIEKNSKIFKTKQNPRNRIGFIEDREFTSNLRRTNRFRDNQRDLKIPVTLASLEVNNFGPIKHLNFNNIPEGVQWIFFTGENGTGKTSILKAIATACTRGTLALGPRTTVSNKYDIKVALNKNDTKTRTYRIKKSGSIPSNELKILTEGFVAFGPIRINITEENKTPTNRPEFSRPHMNLFTTTGYLLDIGSIYSPKSAFKELIRDNDEKLRFIIEAITRICDDIVDIHFGKTVLYFEADEDRELVGEGGIPFRKLASGYKSVIAMISHMMLHLFYQQPKINDPSQLKGIVIIDEIDLHFHPKMQKELVVKLSEIFPRVQFIVSTHSPIPLLGAPSNAVIYRVKRNREFGVYTERMDDKIAFENLLPNSILTSPIFGLSDIIPNSHKSDELLKFEDNYDNLQFNDKLEREISDFMTAKKEKELIALFKSQK